MRKKDSNKASTLIITGAIALLVGFGLLFFGLLSSVALGSSGMALAGLGVLVGIIGAALLLGTIVQGIRIEKGDQKETRVSEIPDAQIVARYAINRIGETIFNAEYLDFDDPKTKLYIKISTPSASSIELRTNAALWNACGEGMRGIAHVQGDWLGQFERVTTAPPTGNPYLKEG